MRLTEEILKELILTEMSRDEMLQKMGETWVQLAFDDDASFVIQAGELLLMSEDDLEPKQFETLKGLVSDQLYNLGRIDAVVELLLDGMDAEVLPLESADKERDYYLETIMVRGGDLKKIYSVLDQTFHRDDLGWDKLADTIYVGYLGQELGDFRYTCQTKLGNTPPREAPLRIGHAGHISARIPPKEQFEGTAITWEGADHPLDGSVHQEVMAPRSVQALLGAHVGYLITPQGWKMCKIVEQTEGMDSGFLTDQTVTNDSGEYEFLFTVDEMKAKVLELTGVDLNEFNLEKA